MKTTDSLVNVEAGPVTLEGFLAIPENATAIVVFVHGSGSSRHSPRNQAVARTFNEYGLATLLFDLLTAEEEVIDLETRHLRFDIPMLAERVVGTVKWLTEFESTQKMKIGLIGSSTGAAAALVAAAELGEAIGSVVSRGGRPDLAGADLPQVRAPTLLVVGGYDYQVIELNEQAYAQLQCEKKLEIVPHATHLFEESGTLEQAAHLARSWFVQHLSH
ncbi:MAG: putative phosphoribosyl transferase [Chlamydiae bacterium]|nr:putative phosphoribosyl transferase [Chlamydiota bacterium]